MLSIYARVFKRKCAQNLHRGLNDSRAIEFDARPSPIENGVGRTENLGDLKLAIIFSSSFSSMRFSDSNGYGYGCGVTTYTFSSASLVTGDSSDLMRFHSSSADGKTVVRTDDSVVVVIEQGGNGVVVVVVVVEVGVGGGGFVA